MQSKDYSYVLAAIPDLEKALVSEFRIVGYSRERSFIYYEWLPDAPDIDEDIFKSEILEAIEFLEEMRPAYFIANDKKRQLAFSEDINEFLVVNFFPIYTHPSVKKIGMIRSDLLNNQSELENAVEQLHSSAKAEDIPFKFFDDISNTLTWIGFPGA